MRTWCDGDQGSTNFSNYERVQDHVNSRRTGKSWTASDTSFWWKWNWIQDEISAGRPVAIHYAEKRDGKINHSAAAYEYNPTTDYICAEKGWVWDPAKVTWDCFTRFEVGDYHVTKLQPF